MVFQRKVSKRLSKLRNKSKRSSRRNSRSSRRNLRSSRRNLRSVTQRKNIRKIFGGSSPLGLGPGRRALETQFDLSDEEKVVLARADKTVLVIQLSHKFKEMLVKTGDTVMLKQNFTAKKYSGTETIEITNSETLKVTQTLDPGYGRVVTNTNGDEIVVPVTTLNDSTFIDQVRKTKVTKLCTEIVEILKNQDIFDDIKNYLDGKTVDNPGDFFKIFTKLSINKPVYKILLNRCQ